MHWGIQSIKGSKSSFLKELWNKEIRLDLVKKASNAYALQFGTLYQTISKSLKICKTSNKQ